MVVGFWIGRQQEERGLGEVGPIGEPLHFFSGQALAVDDDGERVTQIRSVREHINLDECSLHDVQYAGKCDLELGASTVALAFPRTELALLDRFQAQMRTPRQNLDFATGS